MKFLRSAVAGAVLALASLATIPASAQAPRLSQAQVDAVTTPAQGFPQEPGSDYFLANYRQYEAYLQRLAGQTDRMRLTDFGQSTEGRTQWLAIVSSPANLARLEHYQDISRRLARAEGLTDEQARALAEEGKAIVWIDAGLHATETVTTQGQIQVLYRLLTGNDAETLRTLDDVIILFGHVNPDGLDLVADWYMRHSEPTRREFDSIPVLYHKYVGHDNNRDSYMSNLAETININRVLYREWNPQIVLNQHQPNPAGRVVYIPPFRGPFNYNYDPLIISSIGEVGMTLHSRLISEGKGGSGMNTADSYSTWVNGMYRSSPYFHNSIGILTEILGSPTPQNMPLIPRTQLPENDAPMPEAPRVWRLSDTVEYQWSINRATIDYASRNRERLLYNFYRMGANSIQRGSQDTWTTTPSDIDALTEAARGVTPAPADNGHPWARGSEGRVDAALFDAILRDPANRDPRGYVLNPADQRDLPATVTFLNTLIRTGVDVERARAPFTAGGKTYPAGAYVVRTAQAFRPHVLDMFEPQDHPHDEEYPGGPPKRPYDVAGYTLAYQAGVTFDRVLDGFDGAFERLSEDLATPTGTVVGSGRAGWLIGHETNNSFILTNRLLAAGAQVFWLKDEVRAGRSSLAPGALWVPASAEAGAVIQAGVPALGLTAHAVSSAPRGERIALQPVRIGLVDLYGGVMSSGWTRWLLEQYEFPFQLVFPQELDAGGLNARYDVLVFTDGTTPALNVPAFGAARGGFVNRQPEAANIPAQYHSWLGHITQQTTVPQVRAFAENGGTVLTIGGANRLASLMGASADPALTHQENGEARLLPSTEFYIPGSVMRVQVDNRQPLAYGMPAEADVMYVNGQTFRPRDGARSVAWFDGPETLRSGWGHGQARLDGSSAVVESDLGRGKLFLYGAEVTNRAQPLGTFRLFFNGLLYGPAVSQSQ